MTEPIQQRRLTPIENAVAMSVANLLMQIPGSESGILREAYELIVDMYGYGTTDGKPYVKLYVKPDLVIPDGYRLMIVGTDDEKRSDRMYWEPHSGEWTEASCMSYALGTVFIVPVGPEIGVDYRKATDKDRGRKDRQFWDADGRQWLAATPGSCVSALIYRVPVEPEMSEGYRKATDADRCRKDVEFWSLIDQEWLPRRNLTGAPLGAKHHYRVPVDRIPTDDASERRPMVMVRDLDTQEWRKRRLIAVDSGTLASSPFYAMNKDGMIAQWKQCRFPYKGELATH